MIYPDLFAILNWWATWLFLGVISLPLTILWLKPLWDSGYAFSKLVGLVTIGFIVWYGASIKIWPLNSLVLWSGLGLWAVINIVTAWRMRPLIKSVFHTHWHLWLKQEIIFLSALIFWSLIRAYQPDINGLEKFMDYGFVNSTLRSNSMPPADMWFAGGYINYYYFGHYLSAVIIKYSELPPQIAYNLQLGALFALTISGSISITSTVVLYYRQWTGNHFSSLWVPLAGLLTAFLIAVRGNLHWGAYQLNRLLNGCFSLANPETEIIPTCTQSYAWLPDATKDYWYPDATRYIPFTIHEFPIYSFVVADLHAHLINMPLVLMFIAGILALLSRLRVSWFETGILGSLLGIFYMANAWDLPIYFLVLVATIGIIALKRYPLSDRILYLIASVGGVALVIMMGMVVTLHALSEQTPEAGILQLVASQRFTIVFILGLGASLWAVGNQILRSEGDIRHVIQISKQYLIKLIVVLVCALVASLPFHLNFEQIAQGIQPVENFSEHTKLLTLWGWDLFVMISFSLALINMMTQPQDMQAAANGRVNRFDLWVMALYGIGFFLIIIPEFLYVKDIYIQEYHRANTMFKLVYQSWILFGIANSYAIIRLITMPISVWNIQHLLSFVGMIGLLLLSGFVELHFSPLLAVIINVSAIIIIGFIYFRPKLLITAPLINQKFRSMSYAYKYLWISVITVLLWSMANYPIQAINSYYNKLTTYKGLDGESWLAVQSPDEYAALTWLRNLPGQPVILEAVGDSYTEFNRFSAYSGLPTVEGWLVHEWLWRGSYDQPGRRASEVEHIYTATAIDQTKPSYQAPDIPSPRQLIKQYQIEYIIVGDKEKEKYGELLNLQLIESLGEKVFESGNTAIYKVN